MFILEFEIPVTQSNPNVNGIVHIYGLRPYIRALSLDTCNHIVWLAQASRSPVPRI